MPIIAYVKFKKPYLVNIQIYEYDRSGPGHWIILCVYFHPVG